MKRNLLALTLALGALLSPVRSHAEAEVSFQFFYDNLSPYGEWVQVADYGRCWHPNDIDEDWAPYTDGYWSYTDAGWTWVSYEDFGDIVYHYGRWIRTDSIGWCWVPDVEWGPAWVSWRSDDDYIGWAPLPPEAHWRSSVGFSVWVDDYCDIGPSYYNFCPVVEFSAPVIRHVCVPRVNIVNIFARTVNITNISFNSYNNVPFCGGPNFAFINTRVRRPVPALKLVQNTTIINNNTTIINNNRTVLRAPRSTVAGNTLNVFAPKVIKNASNLIQPQVTTVVAKEKVNRGWNIVKDQGEVKQLRDKVKNQSKGLNPDTAPAKPVQIADLKPLPEKADPQAPSPVARPLPPKLDRNKDGIPDKQQGTAIVDQPPGKGPGKVKGDKNGDGKPDAAVAGTAEPRPEPLGKGGKPGRPERATGEAPSQPFTGTQPGSAVVDQPPGKGPGKNAHPGKGKKGEEQPVAPAVGTTEPTQPPVVEPNRVPTPDRGGGLRKPFKGSNADNPIVNEPPTRPGLEAPDREPNVGRGKGKKDQDEQLQIQRQQQRAAELQQQQQQAERAKQAAEARREQMEAQREQTARQQAAEAQREQAARQQAVQAQREQAERQQAARQQAVEAQREQAARQQAIQAQREQQAARQQAMEAQREQAARQQAIQAQREQQVERQQAIQAQREQAARQQAIQAQRVQQAERQQRALEAQREMQAQRQQQMQQQRQQQMQQQQQQPQGGGHGKGKQLSPEEIEALRRGRGF